MSLWQKIPPHFTAIELSAMGSMSMGGGAGEGIGVPGGRGDGGQMRALAEALMNSRQEFPVEALINSRQELPVEAVMDSR